ncbi:MAG TPA: TetR/AcrR family transcriptional regulator [Sphingomicrobium sp.]|nr:TetR/AcrR family transcriptional regulator [Sphingomicrobium sp.]
MANPKWLRRSEDRPREICAAALEVFAENGFAAARVDEIARRAGVSKGTLYLYFNDKEDLFRAVVRDAIAPNVQAITAASSSWDARFSDFVRLFLSGFAERESRLPLGAVAKIVIGESRNFPELARVWHNEVASKALDALAQVIERAQKRGEVREGDARLFAFSLLGPMVVGALWRATLVPVGGTEVDLTSLAKQHAETVLAGLLL